MPVAVMELFECCTPVGKRALQQTPSTLVEQAIEQHQVRRRFPSQARDATCRRMQSQLQRFKGKLPAHGYHQFPVQHDFLRPEILHRLDDLREIACERFSRLGLKCDGFACPEKKAAKAVPFWLELP